MLILAATLALIYSQQAETWSWVPIQGGALGWQTGGLERDGATGSVTLKRFVYFQQPRVSDAGSYHWQISVERIDCSSASISVLESEAWNADWQRVASAAPSTRAVRAGSADAVVKAAVCDGAVVQGANAAPSMDMAMAAAEAN